MREREYDDKNNDYYCYCCCQVVSLSVKERYRIEVAVAKERERREIKNDHVNWKKTSLFSTTSFCFLFLISLRSKICIDRRN